MDDASLLTWPEIKAHAVDHLHKARVEMSEVRDWLKSDWGPAGWELPAADAEARREVLRLVGEVKNLIDQAKDLLHG